MLLPGTEKPPSLTGPKRALRKGHSSQAFYLPRGRCPPILLPVAEGPAGEASGMVAGSIVLAPWTNPAFTVSKHRDA